MIQEAPASSRCKDTATQLLFSSLPAPLYTTPSGAAFVGDALSLLQQLPPDSIDLVLTSPPFALARPKAYGNKSDEEYVDWFLPFAAEVKRVLKPQGSFVFEQGPAYLKGHPVHSLYHIKTLLRLCQEQQWVLAQEFHWFNPAKLPSPVEWVCVQRIRLKDSVSRMWWLAKTENPEADWSNVYPELGPRELSPIDPCTLEHSLWYGDTSLSSAAQEEDEPTNLLEIANTDSNSWYLRCCRELAIKAHPARFPERLPAFFIRGLTHPGSVVLDFFAGSNTTGVIAEALGRRWIAFDENTEYLAASAFHFLARRDVQFARSTYNRLCANKASSLFLDGVRPTRMQ